MRVQIHVDSASTSQVRSLLAELAKIGKHESATVGVNGPEAWTATTPHLTPNEFATVVAGLVTCDGESVRDRLSYR